jgi:hypothetical protein
MANEEHVARLKQGVDAWNAWGVAKPPMHVRTYTGRTCAGRT